MRIALIDPFFDESHRLWAEGLKSYSTCEIHIYAGSAHNWKWKMVGGAINLAKKINSSDSNYDLFLVTDMLNVPLFKSMLSPHLRPVPIYLYFHENQITYPWSASDPDVELNRDHHYGFINYSSSLIANKIYFNSEFHQKSYTNALPSFLRMFPGLNFQFDIEQIRNKSSVLSIGLDLPELENERNVVPTFIWNHRWEYDKNPELFFNTLYEIKKRQIPFNLIVTGKSFKSSPQIFSEAKEKLENEIVHWGYAASKNEYFKLLKKANILLVTANQDFFGISTVEAIAAGCYPILPDRLSYPEHVRNGVNDVFYKNDQQAVTLLENIISKKKYLETKEFVNFVKKYSWKNVISEYDHQFSLAETTLLG